MDVTKYIPANNLDDLIKKLDTLHVYNVHGYLEEHYRQIGSGFYSIAYEVEGIGYGFDGVVVKLGGYETSDPEGDAGGQLWTEFCMEHQHLPAVPQMYYYRELRAGLYIVVMERLDPTSVKCCEDFGNYAAEISYGDGNPVPDYIEEFIIEFDKIKASGCMDLHDQNYMERPGTGEMVVIDPFSGVKY